GPSVDQVLANENSLGEVLWALTDNLGTVRDWAEYDDVLDETDIVNHITYDAFGRRVDETNPTLDVLDLAYTGRYFDRATGLQWNLNRWYDPEVGRWISEDPIGFAARDPNLARYVANQPANATDPMGLY